jgi:hypothetical protein
MFYDAVRAVVGEGEAEKGLWHRPQAPLDLAAATAIPKAMGNGAYVWDRKRSPNDAAPLMAVTGALWALLTIKNDDEPFNIW